MTYLGEDEVARVTVGQVDYPDWTVYPNSASIPEVDTSGFIEMTGTWTVPAGVDNIRVRLACTEEAHSGTVWFDLVTLVDDNFSDGHGVQELPDHERLRQGYRRVP